MEEETKQRLLEKNQRLIDMVIGRAKRDFPEDIALIALSGSFSTGDFHEKSDLDLVIVNNTERGWEISRCFLFDGVGYDIYCTPWDTRIEEEANLTSPMVSCLIDAKVLYYATPAALERFRACQQRARDLLAKPMGREALERAARSLGSAKQCYADLLLSASEGAARNAAGQLLLGIVNTLTHLNNTYIHRGIKRYREELSSYRNLPEDFERLYTGVIRAEGTAELRSCAEALLRAVQHLYEKLKAQYAPPPVPTRERLRGTYEELWCNYRNKIKAGAAAGDPDYALYAAVGAQSFLDEMREETGTPKFDLMQHFNPGDLKVLEREFLRIMDAYLEEYRKVGLSVEEYGSFEELYASFMGEK